MSMGFAIYQAILPQLSYRGAIHHEEDRVYVRGHHSLVQFYKVVPMEYSWSRFKYNGTGGEPFDAATEDRSGVESLMERAFICGSRGPSLHKKTWCIEA